MAGLKNFLRSRVSLSRILLSAAGLSLLSSLPLSASPVDFFATESSSSDENMIRMATDLFFSQIQTIDGYTINDRRKEHYSAGLISSAAISFYAEIQESPDGQWICTLNAVRNAENRNVSSTKKYESYYKILLDAKPSLENLLTNLNGNIIPPASVHSDDSKPERPAEPSPSEEITTPLDSIAGTWTGEEYIEKILILRGGKGFVIFKNGASMNVSVEISGNQVTVTQTGRSNASFFPDMPRALALKNAAGARPVEWKLTVNTDGSMSGTKTSMILKEGTIDQIDWGTTEVNWTKK